MQNWTPVGRRSPSLTAAWLPAARGLSVQCPPARFINLNTKFFVYNAQFLVCKTKSLVFNANSLVFNTEFIIFNAKFINVTHKAGLLLAKHRPLGVKLEALLSCFIHHHFVTILSSFDTEIIFSNRKSRASNPKIIMLQANILVFRSDLRLAARAPVGEQNQSIRKSPEIKSWKWRLAVPNRERWPLKLVVFTQNRSKIDLKLLFARPFLAFLRQLTIFSTSATIACFTGSISRSCSSWICINSPSISSRWILW